VENFLSKKFLFYDFTFFIGLFLDFCCADTSEALALQRTYFSYGKTITNFLHIGNNDTLKDSGKMFSLKSRPLLAKDCKYRLRIKNYFIGPELLMSYKYFRRSKGLFATVWRLGSGSRNIFGTTLFSELQVAECQDSERNISELTFFSNFSAEAGLRPYPQPLSKLT
jgi:hypothetical protein